MRSLASSLVAVLALVSLSACDASTETEASPSFRSSTRGSAINFEACPPNLCGVNAGVAGALSFNVEGDDSLDGLILLEVRDEQGQLLDLHIGDNELYATTTGGELLVGAEMIGTELVFQHMDDLTLTSIFIAEYSLDDVESIRTPGKFFPTYEFTFKNHGEEGEPMSLCGSTPWNDEMEGIDPDTHAALVVGNEAFDWWGNSVGGFDGEPEYASQWLTIGCSGGAFAKKVLLGYDMSQPVEQRPTHVQNQTMMNLLTARYCAGDNHTVTGVDLYWQNELNEFPLPAGMSIEAIWNEHGAVCLNTPRFAERAEIEAECGVIPTCAGVDPTAYHLVSYNAF